MLFILDQKKKNNHVSIRFVNEKAQQDDATHTTDKRPLLIKYIAYRDPVPKDHLTDSGQLAGSISEAYFPTGRQ